MMNLLTGETRELSLPDSVSAISFVVSSQNQLAITASDISGGEYTRPIYIATLHGLDATPLVQLADSPYHQTALRWSPDGSELLVSVTSGMWPGQTGYDRLNIITPGQPLREILTIDPFLATTDGMWSADGERVLVTAHPAYSNDFTYYFHQHPDDAAADTGAGGTTTELVLPLDIGQIRWSPDQRYLVGVEYSDWRVDPPWNRLYRVDLEKNETIALTPELVDTSIELVDWSEDGSTLLLNMIDNEGVPDRYIHS